MRELKLRGGYDNGPLFRFVKVRPPKPRTGTERGRVEKRQTPKWANKDAMRAMYAEARRMTAETGELHVVDHIVPLRGKIVSGFHCEANMRVLHWKPNLMKGAFEWPDMPHEQSVIDF